MTQIKMRSPRLEWIEVGRGVAAMAVVLSHMTPSPTWLPHRLGEMGVEFFFLLSGFIILHVHQADINDIEALPRYVWRRLGRIFPTYWMVLLIVFLANSVLLKADFRPPLKLDYITRQIFILPGQPPLIGPAWTLRHELLFYSIFSVLLLNRKIGVTILGIWAASILIALPFMGGSDISTQSVERIVLHHYNINFFLGMAVALIKNDSKLKLFASASIVLALVLFTAYELTSVNPDSLLCVFASKFAFLSILVYSVLVSRANVNAPRALMLLGSASYSIYLINRDAGFYIERIYRKLAAIGFGVNPIYFVASVSAATLIGVMLHLTFEKPVLKLINSRRWSAN